MLAKQYGVDKCPEINHNYTPTYHSVLNSTRSKILIFLEIGIGNIPLMAPIVGKSYKPGASLRMWRDYFPNASVIGCDIDKTVLFNDEHRIKTFFADQSSKVSLQNLIETDIKPPNNMVDIILDDGSHIKEHQILSFKTLWKYVKSGGFYIIEDVWKTHLDEFASLPGIFGFSDGEVIAKFNDKSDMQGLIIYKKTN